MVGLDALQATPVTAPPPAGLDAALARAESDLSDWVHCPSSQTSAGKAKIAEISARVDAIKSTLKKADAAPAVDRHAAAPAAAGVAGVASTRLVLSGLGTWVDVHA